jgi:CRISPR/Cas system-associated protein Cas7 (RAMP superfamily)
LQSDFRAPSLLHCFQAGLVEALREQPKGTIQEKGSRSHILRSASGSKLIGRDTSDDIFANFNFEVEIFLKWSNY